MPENPNDNEGNVTTPGTTEVVTEDKPEVKTDEQPTFSKEYVEELRREAAKHRTEKQAEKARIESLEAELKKFKDAQLSEEERRKQELEELRNSNSSLSKTAREASLNYKIALAAPTKEIKDIDAAVKLADRDLIEFDSSGNVVSVDAALEDLQGKHPWLFGSTNQTPAVPNTGATNPGKAPKVADVTRADIAKMGPVAANQLRLEGKLKHLGIYPD